MDYMFLFNLTLFNSKQKANSKTFKQKTWQKSYKIQIKTLANPGLAKSGFEELALCLFAIVLHRISLKAQNDYNKISCRSFAEAFLCKTPCATIRLLDERVSVFEHWTSHLAFIDIHHTLPSSCLECPRINISQMSWEKYFSTVPTWDKRCKETPENVFRWSIKILRTIFMFKLQPKAITVCVHIA